MPTARPECSLYPRLVAEPTSHPDLLPLPPDAQCLLRRTAASPLLVAHLILVHDVAAKLVVMLCQAFPSVSFDKDAVLFGAATHDIGKAIDATELTQPGSSHEERGRELLLSMGIDESMARFAYTHGNWSAPENITLEDLIVALADKCWKGKRVDDLETSAVSLLSRESGKPEWDCFADLDAILTSLSADADTRLAWQREFRTEVGG